MRAPTAPFGWVCKGRATLVGVTPDELNGSFVPIVGGSLIPVDIGDERVLLDGWNAALVLNPSGVLIWDRMDGDRSLAEVAADLAVETGAERDQILANAVAFTQELGRLGLLDGVAVDDGPELHLVAVPQLGPGDPFPDVELADLNGTTTSLTELAAGDVLVLNWNPHCGYCVSIASRLAALQDGLESAGVQLVLIAFGDEAANRRVAEQAGITAPILLLGEADSPFGSVGTPSAVHLDSDLVVESIVYGNVEVPRLAESLAGVDPDAGSEWDPDDGDGSPRRDGGAPRYLLEADGFCAPGVGEATPWADTRVYRIGDHHVGIRVDSASTAAVLDELFEHRVVDAPRAGHSYSVALPAVSGGTGDPDPDTTSGLNLLVQPARATVRSRDPGRILRALLGDLHDRIHGGTDDRIDKSEPAGDRLRVNAIAVQVGSGAGLLPINFHAFAPRLQSLLARRGVALADVPRPEIDLATAEVVIPEPAVDHDASVLDRVAVPTSSGGELPAVLPGRYPLAGWCVIRPGEQTFVPLTPAQAAAATVSSLVDADDPVERLGQLGGLFARVPAFGLWYYSDTELADLVARALGA